MDLVLTIVNNVGCLHGLCTFLNMVISENIAKQTSNSRGMVLTIVDNVGVLFTYICTLPNNSCQVQGTCPKK